MLAWLFLALVLLLPLHNILCFIISSMTAFVSRLSIWCFPFLENYITLLIRSFCIEFRWSVLLFLVSLLFTLRCIWFWLSFLLFLAGCVLSWLSISIPFFSFLHLLTLFNFPFFSCLAAATSFSPTDYHGTLFPEFMPVTYSVTRRTAHFICLTTFPATVCISLTHGLQVHLFCF